MIAALIGILIGCLIGHVIGRVIGPILIHLWPSARQTSDCARTSLAVPPS